MVVFRDRTAITGIARVAGVLPRMTNQANRSCHDFLVGARHFFGAPFFMSLVDLLSSS
jgi:hypothetical protein